MIAVDGALIWRISAEPGAVAPTVTAKDIVLPAGETITSVGATEDALTLVTLGEDGVERLRVFDPISGEETGALTIKRSE